MQQLFMIDGKDWDIELFLRSLLSFEVNLRVAVIYDSSSLHFGKYEQVSDDRGNEIADPLEDDEEQPEDLAKGFYCHAKTSLSGGITSYGKGNAEFVQRIFAKQAAEEQGYIRFPSVFKT